ncbi:MAG: putative small lipoprotein YifL [Halopseudomonas sp.]|jgi:predicted small lipoprotein YifL
MKHSILVLLALLVLAGCGQKGALYMPAEKSEEPRSQAEEAMIQQPTER